ncbi:MAG TPA: conjugative transfer signal peptidase TraF [Thermoanaerobaculia bacterium]|nr:conjugative transfer signal peptidase TraF [Thermoanaerobaculia bacterium]
MSGKRPRARRRVAVALALAAAAGGIGAAAGAAGWWINTSASLPRGLYRLERGPACRGCLVLACAPRWAGELAGGRGYLPRGDCPGGVKPLGKIVLAAEGDWVEVREVGLLVVNGRPVAGSAAQAADRAGRPLPHLARGRWRLGGGEVWLFSPHPRSFDSRYFGPVPAGSVRGVLSPVWTESLVGLALARGAAGSGPARARPEARR